MIDTVIISQDEYNFLHGEIGRLRNFLTQLYKHAPEPYLAVVNKNEQTQKDPQNDKADPKENTELPVHEKFNRLLSNANETIRPPICPRDKFQQSKRRTTYPAADSPSISQFTGFNKQRFNQNSQLTGPREALPPNSRALITKEFAKQLQEADRKNKARALFRILKKGDSEIGQFLTGFNPNVSSEEVVVQVNLGYIWIQFLSI